MLGMNKFKTVSIDLIRLSNVVNNDVAKTTLYDYLVTKVTFNTSKIVFNMQNDLDKEDIKEKY